MKIRFLICPFIFSGIAWASQPQILTSFSILKDITQNITPAQLPTDSIVAANEDSHGHQLSASDLLKIRQARVILLIGSGFDSWSEKALKQIKSHAKIYYVTSDIKLLNKNESELHDSHGHSDSQTDPHFWQSPEMTIKVIENLNLILQKEFPNSKNEIKNLAESYINKIKLIQTRYLQEFLKLPMESKQMVISHNSFQYFSKEFGIKIHSPVDSGQGTDPSISKVTSLITTIKKEKIKSLFLEKSSPEALIKQIAKSTNTQIAGTLYSDCLSDIGPADTYLNLLEYNFNLILNTLKGNQSQ